eukprot:354442-Rhodomonas_salina.3
MDEHARMRCPEEESSNTSYVDFGLFQTEQNADIVRIFSCADSACRTNTFLVDSYSGLNTSSTAPPGLLLFSTIAIKIEFNSDQSTQGRGFTAHWSALQEISKLQCQGLSFRSETTGSATYLPTGGYPDDLVCTWIIAPSDAAVLGLEVTVTQIKTEQSFDTLTFRECEDVPTASDPDAFPDPACTSSQLVDTLSGIQTNVKVLSVTGIMQIVFSSDRSDNAGADSGFEFTWR